LSNKNCIFRDFKRFFLDFKDIKTYPVLKFQIGFMSVLIHFKGFLTHVGRMNSNLSTIKKDNLLVTLTAGVKGFWRVFRNILDSFYWFLCIFRLWCLFYFWIFKGFTIFLWVSNGFMVDFR
jgi:hypothetical protein